MVGRRTKKVTPPMAETAAEAEQTTEPDAVEPVFANRAERRAYARRKVTQQPRATGKIELPGRRGGFQAPRNWANRRSG